MLRSLLKLGVLVAGTGLVLDLVKNHEERMKAEKPEADKENKEEKPDLPPTPDKTEE